MPLSQKKLSILYIYDILKENSDADHLLTQNDILEKLASDYGMECERKSIGANIDALIEYGCDIVKNQKGCYLCSRDFEPSEIRFLIDSVFSSRSVDGNYAKELSSKLSSLLNKYQRKDYKYIYKSQEMTRTDSKTIFCNIDIINEAIENKKQISFNYRRFKIGGKEDNVKTYIVNPYFLINNQGKYFLVCNYDYYDTIANYKVERIYNIKIVDKPAKPVTSLKGYEDGFDIAKYANENIYMFGTRSIDATIKIIDDRSAEYVDEWFGRHVKFFEKDGEQFASFKANETSLIYWCLQFGEHFELISPLETREKIKNILNKMNERYK